MIKRFDTALITGATSGIGLEIARQLTRKGIAQTILLVGHDPAKLSAAELELQSEGAETGSYCVDLSQPQAGQRIYDLCEADHREVDLVVNCAGFAVLGAAAENDDQEVEEMIGVNVCSLATLCTHFASSMKQRGAGSILNIASTAAYQPLPYMAAYGASKTFVVHYSEALGRELEDHGIAVTCVSPGPTDSAFWNRCGLASTQKGLFRDKNRDSVADVAALAINATLKKRRHVIVGFRNRLLIFLNRFAPRSVVSRISKQLMIPYHGTTQIPKRSLANAAHN